LHVNPSAKSWIRSPDLLRLYKPEAASHFLQFYSEDSFLIKNLAYLVPKALESGESVVLVATPSHLNSLEEKLSASALDLNGARSAGRYVTLDAAQTLSQFMVDGGPDPVRFDQAVGAVMREASRTSGNGFVFAFGEMVALLCAEDRPMAAVRLEQLWNGLIRKLQFSLYCAYPLSCFDGKAGASAVHQICAEHHLMIPAETLF
jgi:hypothetical protein